MTKRLLSESVKKIVAARQKWRCSACDCLLPSTYQVDHTIPLCDGGPDDMDNTTAMCPNCHALKTQREHVARLEKQPSKAELYETREDVREGNGWRCSSCGATRPYNRDHPICPAIEDPHFRKRSLASHMLSFSYIPRVSKLKELYTFSAPHLAPAQFLCLCRRRLLVLRL